MSHESVPILTGGWGTVRWKLFQSTEAPPAELTSAVFCIAISDKRRVILSKPSHRNWGTLGGHIEDGESIEDALIREAQEEGGFTPTNFQLFAYREITATRPTPHQQPGKFYPFPVSYMQYYWATSNLPIEASYGEEIVESASFKLTDIEKMGIPDYTVIRLGHEAFVASGSPLH